MSSLQNITFGDRDTTHLKYSGNWFLTGSYNASSVGETGTLSSTSDLTAKVTFAFPQPVVAFYYFGIPRCCGGQYGICIDCDPNNPNFITIDALNATDDGHNPPVVLFSKVFDTPGLHEIIITNENDPRFGKSQLTIASIVLEVEGSNGGGSNPAITTTKVSPSITTNIGSSASPSSSLGNSAGAGNSISGSSSSVVTGTGTSTLTRASGSAASSSPSSTSSDTAGSALDNHNSSSSSSHPSIGAIVGGVLAALAFFLLVIILAFWLRLRRRRRAAVLVASAPGLPPQNNYGASSSIIQPFPQFPQGPQMTQSETATPATTSLSSSTPPVSRVPATGKHRRSARPGQGQGGFQSVSTFSDATASSALTGSTPRREIDGGPLYGPVYAEEDTLPPDYRDVFASRRNTTRTVTTPSVHTQAMSETSSARGQANSEVSVSPRGDGLSVSDLSPVRRKS